MLSPEVPGAGSLSADPNQAEAVQSPVDSEQHEAFQHPVNARPLGWQLLLSLANLVVWMAIIPTFQILLPAQIATFDAANKVTLLAVISLAGGITAILGNLLAGALSDRTTSRFGRRRPWIIGGAVLSAASLVLLAFAPGIATVAIGIIILQFCINLDIASLAALVPDQVPVSQRATVSAFAGLALPLGTLIGLILIAQIIRGIQPSYLVLAAVLLIVLAIFVLITPDAVLPKGVMPPFSLGAFLAGFFSPLRSRDFTLTWIGRILVIFGYYTTVGYLLYYLQDVVHYEQAFPGQTAAQGVSIFQVLSTGVLIVATIVSGIISDRLQRRKPFVIAAALIIALALVILALFPAWPTVLVAAATLGLGFGIFLSGDLALQTQVLPEQRHRGKDLGIQNTANLIPQILVPIVVGIVLSIFHSYPGLFLMGAVSACIGAGLILPIRSVR
ncbi:MAG: MFS transporter [Ktedonobacteraceae bacterium]|nr:MFS transporter [Ktedonobacteraceae bacterium]